MTQWHRVRSHLLTHNTITATQAAELLGIGKRRAGAHLVQWFEMGRVLRVRRGTYALNHAHEPRLGPGRRIQLALEARGELTVAEVATYAGMSREQARDRLGDMVDTGNARWVRFGVYAAPRKNDVRT